MSDQITLWKNTTGISIPPGAHDPKEILPHANTRQLTTRDQHQLISAFKDGSYEMVSTFLWTKSLAALKVQLSRLGAGFIAEMLDRPDISESSSIDQILTDYEALRLAEELGIISTTGAFRLRQALERVVHFSRLPPEEAEETPMTAVEAVSLMRACVENILGQERIDTALDFRKFRSGLESNLYSADDQEIEKLVGSPYFFQRASVRILLALAKGGSGAQLENALANTNLIVPLLWPMLLGPERHQIGRAYAETAADGKTIATAGLKKVLLKVKGFDYVPEDIRSISFIRAAHAILEAHEGMNNFHNEAAPTKALDDMGTAVPIPAFPLTMTAVLCVKLGNFYGHAFDAQKHADAILSRVSRDRWEYYLNDCLKTDDRILYKILETKPRQQWAEVVRKYNLGEIAAHGNVATEVKQFIAETLKPTSTKLETVIRRLISKLGYSTRA
jgi:hypothetical protein